MAAVGGTGALLSEDDDDNPSPAKFDGDAEKNAFAYSWEYFKYHAQQRQASFRFYLVVVAAIAALTLQKDSIFSLRIAGLSLAIFSFLFWRLDRRNHRLVALAETYIRRQEIKWAEALGTEDILISKRASIKNYDGSIFRPFTTYSQVNRWIFALVGLVGLYLFLTGLSGFWDKAVAIYLFAVKQFS